MHAASGWVRELFWQAYNWKLSGLSSSQAGLGLISPKIYLQTVANNCQANS
jgi:hypothetical protein